MVFDLTDLNERIRDESTFIQKIKDEIKKVIVGQDVIIERLIIGLLCRGHILIEGVPGLAKTLTISTLSKIIKTTFRRIQFTPDLLPADLIGTLVYNQKTGEFETKKGPIFANIILADEINRSPAKVQSALLEAMQEKQVTIGEKTHKLEEPFLVLATQNPIEQEGTYPLPEAQIDRFMLKVLIGYPSKDEEIKIIKRMAKTDGLPEVTPIVDPKNILKARKVLNDIYVDEKINKYIVDIVFATREPENYGLKDIAGLIEYGASPRASIYLTLAGKAKAFINGRGYVIPEDIKDILHDVLRHRIILTFEAEAEEITSDNIINRIAEKIEVP
ncbi:MAG: AAA family ATPase [Candidatus Marinimicrobia bacterium]|nr:AAA family ATPase [Candidatus Neomarinimicrobiota bacterium]